MRKSQFPVTNETMRKMKGNPINTNKEMDIANLL